MTPLTRLLPAPTERRSPDAPGFREWLAGLYSPAPGPFVRLNFVTSVNGSAVGEDGTSASLTGGVDRRILGVIRAAADVVVVGAGTVREEGYLAPKTARLAIVTRTGDLGGHRLANGRTPPLLLCPPAAADRVRKQLDDVTHEIVEVDEEQLRPGRIVRELGDRGLSSIVCEGGPSLAADFVDAGVVDELCLTIAPKLHAPGLPLFPRLAGTRAAALTQLLADEEGYLYERWSLG